MRVAPTNRKNLAECSLCGHSDPTGSDNGDLCGHCSDILHWLRRHIAETRSVRQELIRLDSSLPNDLMADSFDMIEMVVAIEKQFGVPITFDEALELHTVADAIRHIQTRRREGKCYGSDPK